MNDGRPDRRTARGGAEVIGSKDLTAIHHAAQTFISVLGLEPLHMVSPTVMGKFAGSPMIDLELNPMMMPASG